MAEDNISNIVNNFKDMLNNSSSSNSNTNQSSNINITPEMISNLANMLKNKSNNSNINGSNSSPNNGSFNNSSSENPNFDNFSNNIDFDTILKIKSIMDTLNKKDDPRSNLLYSLKPYLRETRQKKLDQYVNLFKISQVTNLFKNEKGDES